MNGHPSIPGDDAATEPDDAFLDPRTTKVTVDAFGRIQLHVDRHRHPAVKIQQALPFSSPARYVEFRDRSGQSIGMLRDARQLDRASRRVVRAELRKVYFTPRITAIYGLSRSHRNYDWHVQTDRGERQFQSSRMHTAVVLAGGNLLIEDVHGGRYIVTDRSALDPRSKRLLDLCE